MDGLHVLRESLRHRRRGIPAREERGDARDRRARDQRPFGDARRTWLCRVRRLVCRHASLPDHPLPSRAAPRARHGSPADRPVPVRLLGRCRALARVDRRAGAGALLALGGRAGGRTGGAAPRLAQPAGRRGQCATRDRALRRVLHHRPRGVRRRRRGRHRRHALHGRRISRRGRGVRDRAVPVVDLLRPRRHVRGRARPARARLRVCAHPAARRRGGDRRWNEARDHARGRCQPGRRGALGDRRWARVLPAVACAGSQHRRVVVPARPCVPRAARRLGTRDRARRRRGRSARTCSCRSSPSRWSHSSSSS